MGETSCRAAIRVECAHARRDRHDDLIGARIGDDCGIFADGQAGVRGQIAPAPFTIRPDPLVRSSMPKNVPPLEGAKAARRKMHRSYGMFPTGCTIADGAADDAYVIVNRVLPFAAISVQPPEARDIYDVLGLFVVEDFDLEQSK